VASTSRHWLALHWVRPSPLALRVCTSIVVLLRDSNAVDMACSVSLERTELDVNVSDRMPYGQRAAAVVTISFTDQPVTFRRDRFGECWQLIPGGVLGVKSRTLCGQPRQGTPLSETYAEIQPAPPERICELCTTNLMPHPMTMTMTIG
jgi:hypothetical protein